MSTPRPTGEAVAANLARIRKLRNLSLRDLASTLGDNGHPMNPDGINRAEKGTRQVTVDDLVALAAALGVSPSALLFPGRLTGSIEVTGAGALPADTVWAWADGRAPLPQNEDDPDGVELANFYDYGRPGQPVVTVIWLLDQSREFRNRLAERVEGVPESGGWQIDRDETGEIIRISMPGRSGPRVLWPEPDEDVSDAGR